MVNISRLLHSTILVSDLSRATDFYEGLLGFQADPMRPDMGFAGKWYNLGEQQIHLMELAAPEAITHIRENLAEHAGRDRHIAMQVDSVENLAMLLKRSDIPFTRSKSGRNALFCRDPDGNGLEFVQVE